MIMSAQRCTGSLELGQGFSQLDPLAPGLQADMLHTVHPRGDGCRVRSLVQSRDPGEEDLPEDHLHQACQEDQVCPGGPKSKERISSCKDHRLQSSRESQS